MKHRKQKNYYGMAMAGLVAVSMMFAGCGQGSETQNADAETAETPNSETQQTKAQNSEVQDTQTPSESAGCVMPLYPLENAEDAFADGGYSVNFEKADFAETEDGYELTVDVYAYDSYDPEDIKNLKAGDKIQVCRNEITVDDIEQDSQLVVINGGTEQEGVDLIEEDGLYRTYSPDDYPMYYEVGKITIPVDEECTFEDHSDLDKEPDGVVYEGGDVYQAIADSEISFNAYNTVITVRGGKIVQVIRYWTP